MQLAVKAGFYAMIDYILYEHKIVASNKQTRQVDARIILLNFMDESDETFTLRLAIDSIYNQNFDIFNKLWDHADHWNDYHL